MSFEIGAIMEGKVKNITKFGAFVELENGKTGLVHISEISREYVENINDHLQEGQSVKVKVLKMEENDNPKKFSGKIELSIKRALSVSNTKSSFAKSNNKKDFFKSQRNFKNKLQKDSPSSSFEDMLSKFKKASDEKLGDFKEKTKYRGGKMPCKNNDTI
ncbi:MAG: S1 RNA-binding domain-containing protein [Clostridia bacterium]|nr:S1 RNA-binding domain-containing protein [Clostridia bacterium]